MAFKDLAREKWPLNLSMNGRRRFLAFAPTCPTYVGYFPKIAYVEQLGVNKLLFTSTFASVTTKPRDIRQLAWECSQIMAGVYYVVTLAT